MATNKKDLTIRTKPWSYEEAVKTGKELVRIQGKVTLDLVRELYSAREALLNPGYRKDLIGYNTDLVTNVTRLNSFQDYLDEIGLSKMQAGRWLNRYDKENDKLLTQEEFKAMKIVEFESLIKQLNPKFPEWRPDGWSQACESYYQSKIKERHLIKLAESEHFEQLDLFNEAFFATISAPMHTAEEIMHFSEIKKRIESIAYPGAPVNRQAHAVIIVEKVLRDFPEKDRKGVAKALAEATLLLAMEEN